MKKFLLSTVALFGLATGAIAADIPMRAAPPVMAPVPVFTWTGFYVGVNAGYAFAGDDDDDDDLFGTDSIRFFPGDIVNSPTTDGTVTFFDSFRGRNGDRDGFVGGGQVGFNFQLTPGSGLVIGVEADIQFADLGGDDEDDRRFVAGAGAGTYTFGPPPAIPIPGAAFAAGKPLPTIVTENGIAGGIDWFGTVRGRLGFAFDRVLIYGTGGLAFAEGGGCSGFFCDGDDEDWRWGWTVGGGVEYAFTNNLTVKIEGLYVNLEGDDNRRADLAVFDAPSNTLFIPSGVRNGEDDFFVIRGGINFKFGG